MRITLDLYPADMTVPTLALAYVLADQLFEDGEDVLYERHNLEAAGIANAGREAFWAEVRQIRTSIGLRKSQ